MNDEATKMRCGLWTKEGAPVPLRGVEALAVVVGGHGAVVLRQRFVNDESRPIEAIYTFALPAGAALTRFALEAGGRRMEGEVQRREEAFRAYDEALLDGHGAALLEQERDEVATATVGNVLPGEEVLVEVEYIEPLQVDEGVLRWRMPTRVAPRYIPGRPEGDRTGHGVADPTDRVPDADRISPPEGAVGYGLKLDLLFDLGCDVAVESPSHPIRVKPEGPGRVRVSFSRREVALDQDVIVVARTDNDQPLCALAAHREGDGEPGAFELTVVPDLLGQAGSEPPRRVALVLDVSGSMEGPSLEQAVAAARLCLRHLRRGDSFSLRAFSDRVQRFHEGVMVGFDEAALRLADTWLQRLRADGGTELRAPLVEALDGVGDGVVVLLTDGQVSNEREIYSAAVRARQGARIYGFGVGTNVCEGLLRDLARVSGGAVELIHPGEAIDEKVVAQFARATAPRVDQVQVRFEGVEVDELVPSKPAPLVDGEPWSLLGRYRAAGQGKAVIEGKRGGEPFVLEIPISLPERASRPPVAKLWARERIRELEAMGASGRHAELMAERITALALAHGLASRYTSFVVVERRSGERLSPGLPEARVVAVHAPPGSLGQRGASSQVVLPPPVSTSSSVNKKTGGGVWAGSQHDAVDRAGPVRGGTVIRRRRAVADAPPADRPAGVMQAGAGGGLGGGGFGGGGGGGGGAGKGAADRRSRSASSKEAAPPRSAREGRVAQKSEEDGPDFDGPELGKDRAAPQGKRAMAKEADAAPGLGTSESAQQPPPRPVVDARKLLGQQGSSGLWGEGSRAQQVEATLLALLSLLGEGITTAHQVHGVLVRKAVEALAREASELDASERGLAELALAVAWLVATGRRTREVVRKGIEALAGGTLRLSLADEPALRLRVEEALRRGAPLALG